jgi:hypothetical protein
LPFKLKNHTSLERIHYALDHQRNIGASLAYKDSLKSIKVNPSQASIPLKSSSSKHLILQYTEDRS